MNGPRNPIGWCDYTWSPTTGCKKRCSYCYAWKLAKGRLKNLYIHGNNRTLDGANLYDPFIPRFWPERLKEPYNLRKPNKIFICSMGESFGNWIPRDWINRILEVAADNPQHTFQFLTQNPKRYEEFQFPPNCWLGITITTEENSGRTFHFTGNLAQFVKFISFEPLLEFPKLSAIELVDWIILGAQTNPYSPPKREWVEGLISYADNCGIPVFLKNNLKPVMGENLRQEFPK